MTRRLLPAALLWSALLLAIPGASTRQVATFRFRTKVRFRVGNPRLLRTVTLPKYVDVG